MTIYGAAVLLVVFGALLASLDALLLATTPRLLGRLSRTAAGVRTDRILLFRSLPVLLATAVTGLVFFPGWWRYEPPDSGETASAFLLILGAFSALPVLQGLYRGVRMFVRTRDRLLSWQRRGSSATSVNGPFDVVEVKSADLALCVGGYLRPTIYASTEVVKSLEPEELEAALAHEVSHARKRDPLRLLWLSCCPDFLQLLRLDGSWRRAFSSACEFAADAGASRGNPETALDLASALLKVARLRPVGPKAGDVLRDVAVSSAFSSRVDLEARVEALANPGSETVGPGAALRPWMFLATLAALGVTGVVASEQVHSLVEEVGRFLAR